MLPTTCAVWPTVCARNLSLLPDEHATRSIEEAGDDRGLRCVVRRLRAAQPVRIAVLGGSISTGSSYQIKRGDAGAYLYHAQLRAALQHMFPPRGGRHHIVHNGALPATGPSFFEHCLDAQLPGPATPPDMVILEFSINTDGTSSRVSFERMLRKLLRRSPPPAVLVVNVHYFKRECPGPPWSWDNKRCSRRLQSWSRADEDAVASLCRYYNVPLVSMRAAFFAPGSNTTLDGIYQNPGVYMADKAHPNAQGHTYLAQFILKRMLLRTRVPPSEQRLDSACPLNQSGSLTHRSECLIASDHQCTEDAAKELCVSGHGLQDVVVQGSNTGFILTDEGFSMKLGLLATIADSSISFALFNSASTKRTRLVLWLGYLQSYQGMGRARFMCRLACKCKGVVDAHSERRVSITEVATLPVVVEGVGMCQLELRIDGSSSSGGHKFKVMSMILSAARHRLPGLWGPVANVFTHMAAGSSQDVTREPSTS